MMRRLRGLFVVAGLAGLLIASASGAAGPWDQPAAALADQIAAILGPGQARLVIRNVSTVSTDEIPAIRRLLEQDLKAHGVLASGAESANTIRVTLSENVRERLWVAEVIEGNETRVAMVHLDRGTAQASAPSAGISLRRQALLTTSEPALAGFETAGNFIVIEPEEIVIFARAAVGWREQRRVGLGQKKPLSRDSRGAVHPSIDGESFEASVAGMACSGSYQQPDWVAHCRESDDPWPISSGDSTSGPATIKAFYNAARDYFTGVVTPSVGVDLPPFYTAALLPRPDGAGLLIGGIDGKVQLVESGALKTVTGTRDWGSDFAALQSGCGAGTQIIASGSGEALTDSLRAYELPRLEAIPASATLAMEGTVTALWSAPDGKSVFATVRKAAVQGQADSYEVDRVTANCN
jgi:hypothetical protein